MIEVIIKEHLDKALDVPVYLEHPAFDKGVEKPPCYVIFEKLGSSKHNHLLSASVAFQSYAPSLFEAAMLNGMVKDAVEELVALDEVSGVSLSSDYNFTDTDYKRYRYQAVFSIGYY